MKPKTVLLVDDEKGYVEGLQDALDYHGFRVLTATSAEEALSILKRDQVDLATVDIMLPPGRSLESQAPSQTAGVTLCRTIKKLYPRVWLICISVITDRDTINEIESHNIMFLRKGEVPLRTVLDHITTKLLGKSFNPPTND